jgi:hypothetical protein
MSWNISLIQSTKITFIYYKERSQNGNRRDNIGFSDRNGSIASSTRKNTSQWANQHAGAYDRHAQG